MRLSQRKNPFEGLHFHGGGNFNIQIEAFEIELGLHECPHKRLRPLKGSHVSESHYRGQVVAPTRKLSPQRWLFISLALWFHVRVLIGFPSGTNIESIKSKVTEVLPIIPGTARGIQDHPFLFSWVFIG